MTSETFSQTETFDIGKHIGENAKAGDIITLSGDLGVGKTVFAQGVAAGLGIKDHVCSPTFTILQVYDDGRLPLYHFDLYRLSDEDELYAIGADEYWNSDGVCVIEWADMFPDIVWENAVHIEIKKEYVVNKYPGSAKKPRIIENDMMNQEVGYTDNNLGNYFNENEIKYYDYPPIKYQSKNYFVHSSSKREENRNNYYQPDIEEFQENDYYGY